MPKLASDMTYFGTENHFVLVGTVYLAGWVLGTAVWGVVGGRAAFERREVLRRRTGSLLALIFAILWCVESIRGAANWPFAPKVRPLLDVGAWAGVGVWLGAMAGYAASRSAKVFQWLQNRGVVHHRLLQENAEIAVGDKVGMITARTLALIYVVLWVA